MSVTAEQFDVLKVIPYSEARSQLRTGDIVLFSSVGGFSSLIEHFTKSPWSHAAFVWKLDDIDRVILLESVETFGVRAIALSNRINGDSADPKPYNGRLFVARHDQFSFPTDPAKVRAMTEFAIDRLGYPYNAGEIASIAIRITAGLAHHELPGELRASNSFICSEYVANCYDAMGVKLTEDVEGYLAPADIANDPHVHAVASLCPDRPIAGPRP
jgi:hypothetical protein